MPTMQFNLSTSWLLRAPLDTVWRELSTPERWPEWWPAVLAVTQIEPGDRTGVGARRHMQWRTALPYRLSFEMRTTRIEPHRLIEGRSDGELAGTGCWRLLPSGTATNVRYDWSVDVSKRWMRALLPIARPVFEWNHGVVMEWGRRGLERRLQHRASRFNPS